MKNLIGKTIQVQEPSQRFSCDCYIVKDVTDNYIELEQSNNDDGDGKIHKIDIEVFATWKHRIIEDEKPEPEPESKHDLILTQCGKTKHRIAIKLDGFQGLKSYYQISESFPRFDARTSEYVKILEGMDFEDLNWMARHGDLVMVVGLYELKIRR